MKELGMRRMKKRSMKCSMMRSIHSKLPKNPRNIHSKHPKNPRSIHSKLPKNPIPCHVDLKADLDVDKDSKNEDANPFVNEEISRPDLRNQIMQISDPLHTVSFDYFLSGLE